MMQSIKINDIVQISPKINLRENPLMAGFQGCLAIIIEVHDKWVKAQIMIPQQDPLFVNLSDKFIKVVGHL